MLTLARVVCGTQGSARDEEQPMCITPVLQQLVFPQLVL